MEVLIIGYFEDMQSAVYIANSFYELGHMVEGISSRKFVSELGLYEGQKAIINEIDDYAKETSPDLVLVLKGAEMTYSTIKYIKETFPEAPLVNWFFDVYMEGKPIYENNEYLKTLELFDYFFCSLKGVSDKLQEKGYENALYLDEAAYPELNGEVPMNHFQKQKYGEDVAFCGSIGMTSIHKRRAEILKKIVNEGFRLKIWGKVVAPWKELGEELYEPHTAEEAVNKKHSMVCQASKVCIGIDQDRNVDRGHSARLYRVLAAGGVYLLNATKGVEEMFNVNKDGEDVTGDEDLVFYYSEEDLINKLDFLLEHDDIREKIAKNGQEKVLKEHKWTDRITEMIKTVF